MPNVGSLSTSLMPRAQLPPSSRVLPVSLCYCSCPGLRPMPAAKLCCPKHRCLAKPLGPPASSKAAVTPRCTLNPCQRAHVQTESCKFHSKFRSGYVKQLCRASLQPRPQLLSLAKVRQSSRILHNQHGRGPDSAGALPPCGDLQCLWMICLEAPNKQHHG